MTILHRVAMLRITRCSDWTRWYAKHIGDLVPNCGITANDGYRSRERSYPNCVNFVDANDAEPVYVHVHTHDLSNWPFNHHLQFVSHSPRKVLLQREGVNTSWPRVVENLESHTQSTAKQAGQKRMHSLVETVFNVTLGFVLSYYVTDVVMPLYGHHVSHAENLQITGIFTIVSLVRSYVVRRMFNFFSG
jgi:hypothetical protein